MKRIVLYLTLAVCLLLSGCFSVQSPHSITFFAMDTVISATVYGENAAAALEDAQEEVYRLEKLLDADALVTGEPMDTELTQLVKEALQLSEDTHGSFDITVAPYVNAWGFNNKNYRVPDADELEALLPAVGFKKAQWENNSLILPEGGGITLGAVAKGYTGERIYNILNQHNVESAVVSLGGNVILKGSNNGKPWAVGIESPEGDGTSVAIMNIEDCFAVTSGDYHRNFISDGVTYHHIIDPATGYPADSDLSSVTIVSKSGAQADAFSTALFVMGSEKAIDFWRASALEFDMVLITKGGEITVTSPLSEKLTDISEEYTLKIIEK